MTVYVNYEKYSLLIPYDILGKLGDPKYIQLRWSVPERRIIILAAAESDEGALDVPAKIDDRSIFALTSLLTDENPIVAMNWGKQAHSVEPRLVQSPEGIIALLVDLNTATPIDHLDRPFMFMVPETIKDDEDDDECWEDDEDDDEE